MKKENDNILSGNYDKDLDLEELDAMDILENDTENNPASNFFISNDIVSRNERALEWLHRPAYKL